MIHHGKSYKIKKTWTDPFGCFFVRDALNRLIERTHNGITEQYTLDAMGRRLQVDRIGTSQTRKTVRVSVFDTDGFLLSSKDADENETTYQEIMENGLVTNITTHPDGAERTVVRYADGLPKEQSGTAVAPVQHEYRVESNGHFVSRDIRIGFAGSSTEWTENHSDLAGRTIRTEFADGAFEEREFNDLGQLVRHTDPTGVTTIYAYNGRGEREFTATQVSGSGTTIDFTGTDRITRTVRDVVVGSDPGNPLNENAHRSRSFVWPDSQQGDPVLISSTWRSMDGWLEQRESFGQVSSRLSSVNQVNVTREEIAFSPDGSSTVRFHEDGRLQSIRSYDSNEVLLAETTFGYDEFGRQVTETDSRTGTTTRVLDDLGRAIEITDPDNNTTLIFYDSMGRQTKVIHPDAKEDHFEYNLRGQLTKQWGTSYPVEYEYDPRGRRTKMITWQDFDGETGAAETTWTYHPKRGFLIEKRYDDDTGPDYTYDAAGRLLTRTWAREDDSQNLIVTTYDYDPKTGELTSVTYSDNTPGLSYQYDRLGRQIEITDAQGTRTFDYNNELRLESETIPGFADLNLTYTYEDGSSGTVNGRASGFTLGTEADPASLYETGWAYDSAGRLETVTGPGLPEGGAHYRYEADTVALLDAIDFQDANETTVASRTYSYEANRNLVTSIENTFGSTVVSEYSYAHNSIGQRTHMGMNGTAFSQSNHFAYQYDDLRQVTEAERFHGVDFENPGAEWNNDRFAFMYDDIGNRVSSSIGFQPITTTYSANTLNQYAAVGSKTPVYDLDGNLTEKGGWEYAWNGENRLVEARLSHPINVYEMRVTYQYDYQGRRFEKRIWDWNGSTWVPERRHTFVWQGWNLVYEEIEDESNQTTSTRRFTWGLDLSGSPQGAGGVGGLLAIDDDGANVEGIYFYDANGNVGQVVDSSTGTILAHYEYTPFGETITSSGTYAATNPFRFSTKYLDEGLGWYYYGFRYYDPETGRWPNRDPIEERGGLNLYGMVANNPVNAWDVLGLSLGIATAARRNELEQNKQCCNETPFYPLLNECCINGQVFNDCCESGSWVGTIRWSGIGGVAGAGFFWGTLTCEGSNQLNVSVRGALWPLGLSVNIYPSTEEISVNNTKKVENLVNQKGTFLILGFRPRAIFKGDFRPTPNFAWVGWNILKAELKN